MKALVQDGYGGPEVLRIVDLPIPQLGREDVLVGCMRHRSTSGTTA